MVVAGSFCLLISACGSSGRAPAATVPTVSPAGKAPAQQRQGADRPDRTSLAGKVIVIDPGHNGGNARHPEVTGRLVDVITKRKPCDTTGTESKSGYAEHAFTWDVSQRLAKVLRDGGAKVVLTRSDDRGTGPCITRRAAIGNEAKADAAVSIHADGADADEHGFHVIVPEPIRGHTDKMAPQARRLGIALRDSYRSGTEIPYSTYRGKDAIDVRDDLGGLNLSERPKVFIECGNMKHSGDAAKLSSAKFRQRIADSLADGFAAYLG